MDNIIALKSGPAGEIQAQIRVLDDKRIRPTAEIVDALSAGRNPDPVSVARLADLNAQIATLRLRLE